MQYLLVFLEGIATFVSPCMLPMLPVYVAYFAAQEPGGKRVLVNALGFVLGFTAVFVAMGAAAGSVGQLLTAHKTALMRAAGIVMILLGLVYTGLLPIPLERIMRGVRFNPKRLERLSFASAVLFGIVFSVGWTPCIGVFLSAALLMAANSAYAATGMAMLLCFSLGLGIPFVLSALLLERLRGVLGFLKKHLRAVNLVAGLFLVVVGIAMISGYLDRLLTALSV